MRRAPAQEAAKNELDRRRALTLLGGAGMAAALAACTVPSNEATTGASTSTSGSLGSSPSSSSTSTSSSSTTAAPSSTASTSTSVAPSTTATSATSTSTTEASTSCSVIPQETAGPYPGDGSNGPNVLNQSGIVRSDIRSSFGSSSGTAAGVPLTVKLKVLSTADGCRALSGAAVYLWHCDRDGNYSLYSQGVTNQNYLRGVQATDPNGEVTFTSIYPAAYSGRWPHIHFEVYPSLASAASGGSKLRTSQLALPADVCSAVYATSGYSSSVRNLASTSLARDNVFSDGYSLQLATVTGSVSQGYTATLTVPV